MTINKNIHFSCLICLFLLFSSIFITASPDNAYAQPHRGNDHRYGYNHNDGTVARSNGGLGKLTGWGTVVMLFCSTLPCILRRIMSSKIPDNGSKNFTDTIRQFFKYNHYITGLLALILAILHGAIMVTARGKFFNLWIGVAAGVLMLLTVFWGIGLIKQQKNNSFFLRKQHMLFSIFAIVLSIIHILN